MKVEGSAVTGGTVTGHRPLPRASDQPRRPYVEPTRKPTGLDWSTLKPACRTCGTRTSALNRDDQCRTCIPRPATTSEPVLKREPQPRPKRRQYVRPIGPSRPRGTTSRVRLDEGALVAAYRAGGKVPALAQDYGVTPATVRRILDRAGVQRRDDRAGGSGGANRLPDETRAAVARLYAEGLSKSKVAAALGIGMTTVSRIMTEAGITGRKGQSGRADGAAPLKDRIRALGVTPSEINRWALETGLYEIPKPGIPSARTVDAWEAEHQGARS